MDITIIWLLGVVLGVAVLFAHLRLFKIADTLDEILQAIRQYYWIELLESENPSSRRMAVDGLCAILLLGRRVRDLCLILSALGRAGTEAKDALPALMELLKADEEWLWHAAAETIQQIDPQLIDPVELEKVRQGKNA